MESQRSGQDSKIERALFKSEAEFRTLVDASPAIIWFIDRAGHCRYVNRSYLEFFGKTEDQIADTGWHQLIHPDEAPEYIAAVLDAVREHKALCSRSRMCRHDNEWRWIESHGRPHYGANGRYLGLVGHNFDVTDNLEATRILRESEERLRIATEAAQIYTWEVDEDAQAIHHSPNAASILGFDPPEDYAGKAALLHPDDRTPMVTAAERAVREGTEFSQEYRVINPHNGEILWIRSQGIHTGAGKTRRFIGVAQNITARKRDELNATFLAEISDDFSRLCSAADIMRDVGEKVYRYLGISRLTFVNINKSVDEVTGAYEVHEPGVIDCHLAYKLRGLVSESCCQELQAGHTVAIDDIESDPRTAPFAEAYRPYEVRSQLLTPYLSNGRWKFLLCAQHRRVYHWRPDETELMRELTERIYIRLERAYAEAALRQSEEEFRAIFEFSSVGKAQADAATGVLLRVNRKLCEITLYTHEELIGKPFEDLAHPLDHERSGGEYEKMLSGEIRQFDIEKRLQRKDGSPVWVHVNATLLRDAQGKPLRTIAMIQDISARKQTEALLEAELADMRRLQETSSRLIPEGKIGALLDEILNAAIAVTRADMGILQLLDMENNELRVLAWNGFGPACEKSSQRIQAAHVKLICAAALESMRRMIISDVEAVDIAPDAESAAVFREAGIRAIQATPLISRSGQALGMIVTHWRSPRQPAEREMRLLDLLARQAADLIERHQSEAALKKANRRKDEFMAMLGHELRNPLAPIVTALHLMRLKNDRTTERERNVIERQVNHLIRLVDDLLDVSRITSGKIQLKKQWIELSNIVNRAIEMASPLLEQRKHNLVLKIAPAGFEINVDAERMAQAVSNLLTNAAKYTEPGGEIRVTARQRKDWIELKVHDTGIGIDPQLLPQIFDLFTQGAQPLDRSQGGLGLGLTIVRSLVQMHGGLVEARSEGSGKGSEFIIRLPVAETAHKVTDSEQTRLLPQMPPIPNRRYILVVDDNEDAADTLKISLEAAGHIVHVAHDGPSALKLAGEMIPDVAVLDIGLPVMDGYELARQLRAQRGLSQLPLIAISGYGQDMDQLRSKAAGFQAHLVKPVNPDQIELMLRGARDLKEPR